MENQNQQQGTSASNTNQPPTPISSLNQSRKLIDITPRRDNSLLLYIRQTPSLA